TRSRPSASGSRCGGARRSASGWGGPLLALRAEGVATLHHAPAVVAAFLDPVNHLPEVLPHLAAPQRARLFVEAVLPRLAQAVGVDLRPGALRRAEGVVLRDGVVLTRVGLIHVDAQQRAEQVAEVLAGLELVGDAAAVAGADVEVAVRP